LAVKSVGRTNHRSTFELALGLVSGVAFIIFSTPCCEPSGHSRAYPHTRGHIRAVHEPTRAFPGLSGYYRAYPSSPELIRALPGISGYHRSSPELIRTQSGAPGFCLNCQLSLLLATLPHHHHPTFRLWGCRRAGSDQELATKWLSNLSTGLFLDALQTI
jgi:hypothetical protein